MILRAGPLPGHIDEIDPRDMMMMPQFAAAHPRKNDSAPLVQASSMLYPSWWLTRFIENLACNDSRRALIGVNDGSLGIRAR